VERHEGAGRVRGRVRELVVVVGDEPLRGRHWPPRAW
jgi:hypothetical protein